MKQIRRFNISIILAIACTVMLFIAGISISFAAWQINTTPAVVGEYSVGQFYVEYPNSKQIGEIAGSEANGGLDTNKPYASVRHANGFIDFYALSHNNSNNEDSIVNLYLEANDQVSFYKGREKQRYNGLGLDDASQTADGTVQVSDGYSYYNASKQGYYDLYVKNNDNKIYVSCASTDYLRSRDGIYNRNGYTYNFTVKFKGEGDSTIDYKFGFNSAAHIWLWIDGGKELNKALDSNASFPGLYINSNQVFDLSAVHAVGESGDFVSPATHNVKAIITFDYSEGGNRKQSENIDFSTFSTSKTNFIRRDDNMPQVNQYGDGTKWAINTYKDTLDAGIEAGTVKPVYPTAATATLKDVTDGRDDDMLVRDVQAQTVLADGESYYTYHNYVCIYREGKAGELTMAYVNFKLSDIVYGEGANADNCEFTTSPSGFIVNHHSVNGSTGAPSASSNSSDIVINNPPDGKKFIANNLNGVAGTEAHTIDYVTGGTYLVLYFGEGAQQYYALDIVINTTKPVSFKLEAYAANADWRNNYRPGQGEGFGYYAGGTFKGVKMWDPNPSSKFTAAQGQNESAMSLQYTYDNYTDEYTDVPTYIDVSRDMTLVSDATHNDAFKFYRLDNPQVSGSRTGVGTREGGEPTLYFIPEKIVFNFPYTVSGTTIPAGTAIKPQYDTDLNTIITRNGTHTYTMRLVGDVRYKKDSIDTNNTHDTVFAVNIDPNVTTNYIMNDAEYSAFMADNTKTQAEKDKWKVLDNFNGIVDTLYLMDTSVSSEFNVTIDAGAYGSVSPSSITLNYGDGLGSFATGTYTVTPNAGYVAEVKNGSYVLYTDSALTTKYEFGTRFYGATTLYLGWEANVTFNANGGTPATSVVPVKLFGKATKPTDPTCAGNSFLGWYTSSDNGTTLSAKFDFENTAITGPITLYAKWVSTVTVTFNYNGKGTNTTLTYNHGDLLNSHNDYPANVEDYNGGTDNKYFFAGWWENNGTASGDWGDRVDPATYSVGETNVELYARWTKIENAVYANDITKIADVMENPDNNHSGHTRYKAQYVTVNKGDTLKFYYNNSIISSKRFFSRTSGETGGASGKYYFTPQNNTAVELDKANSELVADGKDWGSTESAVFSFYYDGNGCGDGGIWIVKEAGAFGIEDVDANALYPLTLYSGNTNEVYATDITIGNGANDHKLYTIKVKYNGEYKSIGKLDTQSNSNIVASKNGELICVYSGKYSFYYNNSYNENGYSRRLYIGGTQYGQPATVVYHDNGSGAIANGSVSVGNKIAAPTAAWTGHTLAGWYTDPDFETGTEWAFATRTVVEDDINDSHQINLYAKWNINKYTVTFKDASGTVVRTDNNVEHGTVYTSSTAPAGPSKAADAQYTYTFSGWSPAFAAITGDTVYTPTYTNTVNKYTVTFANRAPADNEPAAVGTPVMPAAVTKDYGTSYTLPTSVTTEYTSHSFVGWELANGTTVSSVTVEGNITVYAKWQRRTYNITWKDGDNNTLATDTVGYGITPNYVIGTGHATPTKAQDDQYTYAFNNTWTPTPVAATANATYTAQFDSTVREYTVSFTLAGTYPSGLTKPADQTVGYGSKATDKTTDLTKDGYSYTLTAGGSAWSFNDEITSNTAVTVTYTRHTYTVTYTDGGTHSNSTTLYVENLPYSLGNATKDYYGFSGWSKSGETGTITQLTKSDFNMHADSSVTLTANWNAYTYTVTTYNANNGTMPQSYKSVFTVADAQGDNITLPEPTRDGWTFTGWKASASDTAFKSIAKTTIKDGSVTVATLTADWTQDAVAAVVKYHNGESVTTVNAYVDDTLTPLSEPATGAPTADYGTVSWLGWYESGATTAWNGAVNATEINVYATWTTVYSITLNANGGKFSDNSTTKTIKVANGGSIGTLKDAHTPTITQPDYGDRSLLGWKNGATDFALSTTIGSAHSGITLTAQWTAVHTVAFEANLDGETVNGIQNSVTVAHGAAITSITDPTCTNYEFVQWHIGSATGTVWTAAHTFNNDTTLYAEWIKYATEVGYYIVRNGKTKAYDEDKLAATGSYMGVYSKATAFASGTSYGIAYRSSTTADAGVVGSTLKTGSTTAANQTVTYDAFKNVLSAPSGVVRIVAPSGTTTLTYRADIGGTTATPTKATVTVAGTSYVYADVSASSIGSVNIGGVDINKHSITTAFTSFGRQSYRIDSSKVYTISNGTESSVSYASVGDKVVFTNTNSNITKIALSGTSPKTASFYTYSGYTGDKLATGGKFMIYIGGKAIGNSVADGVNGRVTHTTNYHEYNLVAGDASSGKFNVSYTSSSLTFTFVGGAAAIETTQSLTEGYYVVGTFSGGFKTYKANKLDPSTMTNTDVYGIKEKSMPFMIVGADTYKIVYIYSDNGVKTGGDPNWYYNWGSSGTYRQNDNNQTVYGSTSMFIDTAKYANTNRQSAASHGDYGNPYTQLSQFNAFRIMFDKTWLETQHDNKVQENNAYCHTWYDSTSNDNNGDGNKMNVVTSNLYYIDVSSSRIDGVKIATWSDYYKGGQKLPSAVVTYSGGYTKNHSYLITATGWTYGAGDSGWGEITWNGKAQIWSNGAWSD